MNERPKASTDNDAFEKIKKLNLKGVVEAEHDKHMLAVDRDTSRESKELSVLLKDQEGLDPSNQSERTRLMREMLQYASMKDLGRKQRFIEDVAVNPESMLELFNNQDIPLAKEVVNAADAIQRLRYQDMAKEFQQLIDKRDKDEIQKARSAISKFNIS